MKQRADERGPSLGAELEALRPWPARRPERRLAKLEEKVFGRIDEKPATGALPPKRERGAP